MSPRYAPGSSASGQRCSEPEVGRVAPPHLKTYEKLAGALSSSSLSEVGAPLHSRTRHDQARPGEVNDVSFWSARKDGCHMPSRPSGALTIDQVLTLLAETPLRLATLADGLAPAHLHTAPTADGWSANDVLAHLRACADVWGNCMVRMLSEDTPTLRAVNPRTWIKTTDYRNLAFLPSLRSFASQRA